jgi:hypothetical protein
MAWDDVRSCYGLVVTAPQGVTITGVKNQKDQGVTGLSLKMRG